MTEHTVIENITRDIGNYIKNNIEEIREKHPEFRRTMRNISREMTDYLKDQGRVEIGTKGNMVANSNGKKARRDVIELSENEIALKDEVRELKGEVMSLGFIRDELTDDRDRLGVRVGYLVDIVAGLRDQKLREDRRWQTENYIINDE